MALISLSDACEKLPYTRDQINETIRDFDLKRTETGGTDGKPLVVAVDEEALRRALEARNLNAQQQLWAQAFEEIRAGIRKLSQGWWATILTTVTALAALGTAWAAWQSMEDSKDVLSARSNYEVLSKISDRIVDSRMAAAGAAAATTPPERARFTAAAEIYAEDLDTQVQLLDALNEAGIIVGDDWKATVSALCKPMHRENYHERGDDLFVAFRSMCEKTLEAGDWSPEAGD